MSTKFKLGDRVAADWRPGEVGTITALREENGQLGAAITWRDRFGGATDCTWNPLDALVPTDRAAQ